MRVSVSAAMLVLSAGAFGCGGADPPVAVPAVTAEAAAPPDASAASAKPEGPSGALPTACDDTKDGACLPEAAFVKRLCATFHPEVALAMFAKGTPWTRGYLRGAVDAWNASGGLSSADKLAFDEEVIVVRRRSAGHGPIHVSGAGGGYDVLRWDGSCASLTDGELTLKAPPTKPKAAKIPWRNLEASMKSALSSDEKIGKAVADRRKECTGEASGDVTPKCAKADEVVSGVIVDYVRAGGAVPAPTRMP
ncbi:MAG TPA: hypothetical protein VGM56_15230 [Byssovorax sp.]|jgi:hypothetical protein